MPEISVIIPAYNAQAYIGQCLQSLASQTFPDFEVCVVDDGSTDSTPSIVQHMAASDSRIRLISQENSFAGVARNNGIEHTDGEYLYFLDADDYLDTHALESLLERARSTQADVVVCRSASVDVSNGMRQRIDYALRYVDMESVCSGHDLDQLVFRFCVGWPWDKMFRRSFIERHALRFEALRTTNDAYFVFCALILSRRVAFVDDELVYHRVNNSSSLEGTRDRSWENAFIAASSIEKRLHDEGLYEEFERAFLNWLLDFSLWNFVSLSTDNSAVLLKRIEDEVLPRLPLDDEGYIYDRTNYLAARAIASPREQLLSVLISNRYRWRALDVLDEPERIDSKSVSIETELAQNRERADELEAECARLRTELAQREQAADGRTGRRGHGLFRKG